MTSTNGSTLHNIGVGLISVGWMGKLHTWAYLALPTVYAEYAREILGACRGCPDQC